VGLWKNESPNFKTRDPQKETVDFIDFLRSKKITKGKVLDLGCGGGRHVILFAKQGFESYGIDFSKTAVKLAKIDAKDKKVEAHLKVGDVLRLPYKKNTFDIVHDSGCLHHLSKRDWNIYLKNVLKVLKKGGYFKLFAFSDNTRYLTGHKILKTKNWIVHKAHYTHFFSKKEIKDFFSEHFNILNIIEEKRKDDLRSFYIAYMQKK